MPTMNQISSSRTSEFSICKVTCVWMSKPCRPGRKKSDANYQALKSEIPRNETANRGDWFWLMLISTSPTNGKTEKFLGKNTLTMNHYLSGRAFISGGQSVVRSLKTSQHWRDHLVIVDLDRWCTISIWQETHGSTKFLKCSRSHQTC